MNTPIKTPEPVLAETNAICSFPRDTRKHYHSFTIDELQDFIAAGRVKQNLNLETGIMLFVLARELLSASRPTEALEAAFDILNFIECSDVYFAICRCAFEANRYDVFKENSAKLIEFTVAEFGDKKSRYKDVMNFIKMYGKKSKYDLAA